MKTDAPSYQTTAKAAMLCPMSMVKSVVGLGGLIRRDWRVAGIAVNVTKHGRANPGSGVT